MVEIIGLVVVDAMDKEWANHDFLLADATSAAQALRATTAGRVVIVPKGTSPVLAKVVRTAMTIVLDSEHVEMTAKDKAWRRTPEACRELALSWAQQSNHACIYVVGAGIWSNANGSLLDICDGLVIYRVIAEADQDLPLFKPSEQFEHINLVRVFPHANDVGRIFKEFWRRVR